MTEKFKLLDNQSIGIALKQLRKKQKLSINDFSQSTGICLSYITMVEQGEANPSVEVLKTLFAGVGRNLVFSLRRQRQYAKAEKNFSSQIKAPSVRKNASGASTTKR